MPNLHWSNLTPLQLGKFAEYYAKMEFASYGFDVYTSEVDDHGVDFIAKGKDGVFYEVQVKSILKSKYVFMQKEKQIIDDKHLIAYLRFQDDVSPQMYVIPSTVFHEPNDAFVSRDYEGKKSKPEWGINYSEKASLLLESYRVVSDRDGQPFRDRIA